MHLTEGRKQKLVLMHKNESTCLPAKTKGGMCYYRNINVIINSLAILKNACRFR